MIENRTSMVFLFQNICTGKHLYLQFSVLLLLIIFLIAPVTAAQEPEKNYLRIEKSNSSETDDLDIVSIGVLVLNKNMVGHVDLSSLKSDMNGNAVTLDFGGGYAFNWDISLFIGFGISLGYNKDNNDTIAAYYPEAGIVMDLTKTFGITASTKRYHHLYKENEAIVMMGLVFRN